MTAFSNTPWRALLLLVLPLALVGCPTADDDDSADGPTAYIQIAIASDETQAILDSTDSTMIILSPSQALVDENGVPYPPGPLGVDEMRMDDRVGDSTLELLIPIQSQPWRESGLFPLIGLDPGANVPMTFTLLAIGLDGSEDVAESPMTEPYTVSAGEVITALIEDYALIEEEVFACEDGIDNDGDGWTDMSDPDCDGNPDGENTGGFGTTECNDGIDNDGDTFIDSEDPDCDSATDDKEAEDDPPVFECDDQLDNDGDGWIDMADPGCDDATDDDEGGFGTTECNDGIDNDGDGPIDGLDSDCEDALDPLEGEPPPPECSDGIDNDVDCWIDLDDPSCANDPNGTSEVGSAGTACNDGLDNDTDGDVDCADAACVDGYGLSEVEACNDGVDNDGDGWIDLDDPGCTDATDPDETDAGTTECNDGIDNDNDGDIDCADADCDDGADTSETPACTDGVDNDSDGWTDALDAGCADA